MVCWYAAFMLNYKTINLVMKYFHKRLTRNHALFPAIYAYMITQWRQEQNSL